MDDIQTVLIGLKTIKTTKNPIYKKDNKYLQYAVAVLLNHEEIGKNPERITKNKPFVIKYSWEGINLPSEKENVRKI